MILADCFDTFLETAVNLNPHRIGQLNDRVDAITTFLSNDEVFGEYFVDVIPQGSYAHRTIIKPVGTREYDADILLALNDNPAWGPADYTHELRRVFNASSTYAGMAHKRTRCVYIDYANEFHVDIVPYVVQRGSITDNKGGLLGTGAWQRSCPEKFTEWLEGKYRISNEHLAPTLRLFKYLRDFKTTFAIKSIILTILVGEQVTDLRATTGPGYPDLPTTFVRVLEDLDLYLRLHPTLPAIPDPALSGQDFRDRWDQDGYANFAKWVTYYAQKSRAALDAYIAGDNVTSLALWQGMFGTGFVVPAPLTKAAAVMASGGGLAPAEEFIDQTAGIKWRLTDTVRLVGRVRGVGVRKAYDLPSRGDQVAKGRTIDFRLEDCTVTGPYEVFWKVRNRGEEAVAAQQLRGKLERTGTAAKEEHTKYVGRHYVDVYLVQNGYCVATSRQPVIVAGRG